MRKVTHWLSYGGGVNSTALAILLASGAVAGVDRWRVIFADTHDEKDATYEYIDRVMRPWLRSRGKLVETVSHREGVIKRWERMSVTGSRLVRSCSVDHKIKPIMRYITAFGTPDDVQLIGIHAGEEHRAKDGTGLPRRYPLIELGIDQAECIKIIKAAGLPVPVKSGCWHCPFMRKAEIIELAVSAPDRFGRIVKLEDAANREHPADDGTPRTQWGTTSNKWRSAREWAALACQTKSSGELYQEVDPDPPCACFDGEPES